MEKWGNRGIEEIMELNVLTAEFKAWTPKAFET
jgi:hypothetical protein